MTRSLLVAIVLTGLVWCAPVSAAELVRWEWKVGELTREGLVHAPGSAKETATPLVFVFHGHGGTARNAARQFRVHELWPEAIVVYLQGVPTPGRLTDPAGERNGWGGTGAAGERDVKFFDAVLKWAKDEYKVDEKSVFCTGHSNGGMFTYVLWAERGDVFAAVAPSAAAPGAPEIARKLKPKAVMHCAGEKDELVKFEWQKAAMERLKKLNGCEGEGKKVSERGTRYESAAGDTPVVTWIHPGGHGIPKGEAEAIVEFFKSRVGKGATIAPARSPSVK